MKATAKNLYTSIPLVSCATHTEREREGGKDALITLILTIKTSCITKKIERDHQAILDPM